MLKKFLLPVVIICLVGFAGWRVFSARNKHSADETNNKSQPAEQQTEPKSAANPKTGETFDKTRYSTSEPESLWIVVNKQRALPAGYVPADLVVPDVRLRSGPGAENSKFRAIAAADLKDMFDAAARGGVTLVFGSGYRSYALQKQLYNGYVARDGQSEADRYSARPGTSEHQTGLAFDAANASGTCYLEICFANTAEGKWIAGNAHKYGFIVRYPNGKESVTTYQYEPWHLRYVGKELAAEIYRTGQTLEEFFGL